METKRFQCRHCRKIHPVRVKGQKYCGEKKCQLARGSAWYREKCAGDADYRANQRSSTQTWLESKGGAAAYYRDYRRRRKAKAEKEKVTVAASSENKASAGLADRAPIASEIKALCKCANIDAIPDEKIIKSGRYKICPADANIDAILVEISLVSSG